MTYPWLKPEWRPPASVRATIVFTHGAIVDGYEMGLLRRRMRQLGYKTRLFQYRSMMRGLDHNVELFAKFIKETKGDIIHVIGHSMGGVLTRHVFEQSPDPRPGRLIAMASPLVDCWIGHRARRLHQRVGRLAIGRTVHEFNQRAPDPVWRGTRDFGVMAGTYPFGVGRVFPDLPAPSDGVVPLEDTYLQGIRDHVAYRINHFGLLLSKRCAMQVACFLATGAFAPDPTAELGDRVGLAQKA